jgi:hypothetical protein
MELVEGRHSPISRKSAPTSGPVARWVNAMLWRFGLVAQKPPQVVVSVIIWLRVLRRLYYPSRRRVSGLAVELTSRGGHHQHVVPHHDHRVVAGRNQALSESAAFTSMGAGRWSVEQ